MTQSLFEARLDLQDVLKEENAALSATNLAEAAALLPRKTLAIQNFLAAQAPGSPPKLGRILTVIAEDNTRLLEHAIQVQARVVEIIARAARRSDEPETQVYGMRGRETRDGGALALHTRA